MRDAMLLPCRAVFAIFHACRMRRMPCELEDSAALLFILFLIAAACSCAPRARVDLCHAADVFYAADAD